MGVVSFVLSIAGMVLTLLSFAWDLKFLPPEILNMKVFVLSFLLPFDMVLLSMGLITGIIAYASDSKRDIAMLGIIFSAFFGLICLNNIIITFEVLDKIKFAVHSGTISLISFLLRMKNIF